MPPDTDPATSVSFLGDAFGWLLAALVGLVQLAGFAFDGLFWLIGWIWWPFGQVLGFLLGLGYDAFAWAGSALYAWCAEAAPGVLPYFDLLSFGPDGWGDELWAGLQVTLKLAVVSLAIGLCIGLMGAGAKLAPNKVLNRIGNTYTTLIRGVPELLTLFIIYYGLQFSIQGVLYLLDPPSLCAATNLGPKLGSLGLAETADWLCALTGLQVSGFAAGVIALSLVFGAFATEVLRGAILAVPKGQLEAARAIGMTRALMIRRVLLPQVWRYALPGLGNLWLIMVKDTSLVSVIALDELMRKTSIAVGVTKQPFLFYGAACLVYLSVTGVSMIAFARIERWASRGVRRA